MRETSSAASAPRRSGRMMTPAVVSEISAPATLWDAYFSIPALVAYSSLSERMLRGFLREDRKSVV